LQTIKLEKVKSGEVEAKIDTNKIRENKVVDFGSSLNSSSNYGSLRPGMK